jgi:anti-sigma regulatory factor (Ser/Thr protein kinase)
VTERHQHEMESRDVLTFAATRAGFERAFRQLRTILDRHPLQRRARYRCELVFEEVVSNIIRHGSADDRKPRISMTLGLRGDRLELRFEDDGVPFDPRQPAAAPVESPLGSDRGGRGLLLVRSVAEHLDYERTPQQRNQLTVTIAAGPSS